jgi:hypothetical protein
LEFASFASAPFAMPMCGVSSKQLATANCARASNVPLPQPIIAAAHPIVNRKIDISISPRSIARHYYGRYHLGFPYSYHALMVPVHGTVDCGFGHAASFSRAFVHSTDFAGYVSLCEVHLAWPESNQHSLRNSILSRARLPVPPQGPSGHDLVRPVAKPAERLGREVLRKIQQFNLFMRQLQSGIFMRGR